MRGAATRPESTAVTGRPAATNGRHHRPALRRAEGRLAVGVALALERRPGHAGRQLVCAAGAGGAVDEFAARGAVLPQRAVAVRGRRRAGETRPARRGATRRRPPRRRRTCRRGTGPGVSPPKTRSPGGGRLPSIGRASPTAPRRSAGPAAESPPRRRQSRRARSSRTRPRCGSRRPRRTASRPARRPPDDGGAGARGVRGRGQHRRVDDAARGVLPVVVRPVVAMTCRGGTSTPRWCRPGGGAWCGPSQNAPASSAAASCHRTAGRPGRRPPRRRIRRRHLCRRECRRDPGSGAGAARSGRGGRDHRPRPTG